MIISIDNVKKYTQNLKKYKRETLGLIAGMNFFKNLGKYFIF